MPGLHCHSGGLEYSHSWNSGLFYIGLGTGERRPSRAPDMAVLHRKGTLWFVDIGLLIIVLLCSQKRVGNPWARSSMTCLDSHGASTYTATTPRSRHTLRNLLRTPSLPPDANTGHPISVRTPSNCASVGPGPANRSSPCGRNPIARTFVLPAFSAWCGGFALALLRMPHCYARPRRSVL